MTVFVEILSLIGAAVSIAGVSLKDLLPNRASMSQDRQQIESFIRFLEGRKVLFAGMDDEVHVAVVRSLEEIKREAEQLRLRCSDEKIQTVLLHLLLTMSTQLQKLHGITGAGARDSYKMYLTLQSTRFELSRTLALLCTALGIVPSSQQMRTFVLDFAARPR